MYLALYRKYRPRTFRDVISQQHITTTLTNQLKTGQVAHAYLFTGSRGTGKTSCAKILAKAVNCLHPVDGNPCLECEACKLIDGNASDIFEIDAASNNGIDDVRALRDEVMYAPINCKYRVYIIDEVHMLSVPAFNALLKTIEEPPGHVVFILATTEIHKVPATILSRCQRFEFRRIDLDESAERLMWVAEQEKITLQKDAAYLISRISDGGMRDALSLLDQCISVSENITVQVVKECAGVAGKEHLFAFTDAVLEKNPSKALGVIDGLYQQSKDLSRFVTELIEHYRTLMLLSVTPDSKLIRALPDELEQYKSQLGNGYGLPLIMRCIDILTDCLGKMGGSSQRKIQAEMTAIRLCNPKLDSDVTSLTVRMDSLEGLVKKALDGQLPASPSYERQIMAEMPPVAEATPQDMEIPPSEIAATAPEETPPLDEQPEAGLQPVTNWVEIIDSLPPSLAGLIENSRGFYSGNAILVQGSLSVKDILSQPENNEKLKSAIERVLGKSYAVVLSADEASAQQEENRIESFLAFAKEQGVTIKRK